MSKTVLLKPKRKKKISCHYLWQEANTKSTDYIGDDDACHWNLKNNDSDGIDHDNEDLNILFLSRLG